MEEYKDEGFKKFFKQAVGGVNRLDAEDKTERFFEIMTRKPIVDNFRELYYKAGKEVGKNDQEVIELSPKQTLFFITYVNILYTTYMSMIDVWKGQN